MKETSSCRPSEIISFAGPRNNASRKTHELDVYAFEKLKEYFGNFQIRSITVQKLLDWKSRLDLSETSSNMIIRRLQAAWNNGMI